MSQAVESTRNSTRNSTRISVQFAPEFPHSLLTINKATINFLMLDSINPDRSMEMNSVPNYLEMMADFISQRSRSLCSLGPFFPPSLPPSLGPSHLARFSESQCALAHFMPPISILQHAIQLISSVSPVSNVAGDSLCDSFGFAVKRCHHFQSNRLGWLTPGAAVRLAWR